MELTLCTASGQHHEKGWWKASYHTVWHQLVVDLARANVIRLQTVTHCDERLRRESWLWELTKRLWDLSSSKYCDRMQHAPTVLSTSCT